jgi:hypothetical protein
MFNATFNNIWDTVDTNMRIYGEKLILFETFSKFINLIPKYLLVTFLILDLDMKF